MQTKVAIIGAGLAGVTAARRLVDGGCQVVVFEKSRGLGGRLATRRTDLGPIDHGAPGVPAAVGLAAGGEFWPDGPNDARTVGLPGMSALARSLAAGIDVRQGIIVTGVTVTAEGWRLSDAAGGEAGPFDAVILAVPAPQAEALLARMPAMAEDVAAARMSPVWTLLLGFDVPTGLRQEVLILDSPLAMAVPMLAKPGQTRAERWTVHAGPYWSKACLELDRGKVGEALLAAFRTATGLQAIPAYAAVHRWRYARVERALGQPFVMNPEGTLLAGGDWTLGPLATDAAESGEAMARHILAARGKARS